MNSIRWLGFSLLVVALYGMAGVAHAEGGCWVEIYDQTGFLGNGQRVAGPARVENLRSLDGKNWGNRIDSLIVGPDAEVWLYRQEGFRSGVATPPNHPDAARLLPESADYPRESEVSFGPGQKEHHLGELNFHRNTNSLRIECGRKDGSATQ